MTRTHRVELIPAWLFLTELFVCLVVAIPFTFLGLEVVFFLAGLLIVAYSLGAYDVLSLTRHQSERAPFQAAGIAAAIYATFVLVQHTNEGLSKDDLLRFVAVLFSLSAFVLLHRWLRRRYLGGAKAIAISVPVELSSYADVIRHHLALSGYPGRVTVGSVPESAATNAAREPEKVVFTTVAEILQFCDETVRVLPAELLESTPGFLLCRERPRRFYGIVKRASDVLISSLVLLVTAPLWVLAIVGILVTNGRPVFYSQFRMGTRGTFFRIIKFRTLKPANRGSDQDASPTKDMERRAYPFGTFLRRSRIDELPQLLMVIRGTMSLVGPRPEMVFFHRRSVRTIPLYEYRLYAKPGLTGWAQIRYAHTTTEEEYRDKTAFDLWYVANRGIAVDSKIMLRTIGILLNRFGSK